MPFNQNSLAEKRKLSLKAWSIFSLTNQPRENKMKTLVLMIIALFSNYTLANNWQEQIQNREGYSVRLSYTSQWLPATYGTEGGSSAGLFYIDVFSQSGMNAEKVEISEVLNDGREMKISDFKFKQDNSRHFYAQKPAGKTYADQIWARRTYVYRIMVDGRMIEGKFKI
jgi:hypothetical protein